MFGGKKKTAKPYKDANIYVERLQLGYDQTPAQQLGYPQTSNNYEQNIGNNPNTNPVEWQSNDNFKTSQNSYNQSQQQSIWKSNVKITSKKAKKNLDVCQDKDALGMLIIYQDFKQPNQRFDIVKEGQSFFIISKPTRKLLGVASNSDKNGSPIFQNATSGMIGQRFRFAPVNPNFIESNQYFIHTFCGKVLDCCEEGVANGTRVIQYTCDRKEHQIWVINQ